MNWSSLRVYFIYNIWPYIKIPYTAFQIIALTFVNIAITTFILKYLSFDKAIGIISLTEEATRTLSFVIMPWPFLYTLFMSIQEFFMYIYRNPDLCTPQFVTMRMLCIGMHFLCYWLQLLGFRRLVEDDELTPSLLFILLAYFTHVIYNTHVAQILISIVYNT